MLRAFVVTALLLVVLPGQSKEPWTVEDIVKAESVRGMALRSDGRFVAWLKVRAELDEDRYRAKLHVTDLETQKSRQVVFGDDAESSPLWSPDGSRLAYLTARKVAGAKKAAKGNQVWVLRMDGGEPRPVTAVEGGVRGFRWLGNDALMVTARENKTRREREAEKRKDRSRVVEGREGFADSRTRLFRVTLKEGGPGKLERITEGDGQITSFAPSPDGKWVVYTRRTTPIQVDGREPARVLLRSLVDGAERELFADRKNRPRSFDWEPGSGGFYALVPRSTVDGESSAAISVVYRIDVKDPRPREVQLGWDRGIARGGLSLTRDGFVALLRQGVVHRPFRFSRGESGWKREPLSGKHTERLWTVVTHPGTDRVVYMTSRSADPDRWCSARLAGAELEGAKEFLRPNGGFGKRRLARAEVLTWKGAEGEAVEGILYYPQGYEEGKKYPLIVMPHGGPHGADMDRFRDRWSYPVNLYTERGALCLFLNYHGSEGYGLAWGESIKARYYELEVKDILAGVDALVKAGKADPDRLGLLGWSNGAILAIATLTHADDYAPGYDYRFRACAPGAGDVNWTSDYGNCAFGVRFDDFYLGGPPWKMPDLYVKKSPLFRAETVTTPTIIFFGEKDTAVPTEQGWQWYRALQQIGKAPVRFVLFPGQPHGLLKPSFRRRKMAEELAWFDRYLFERKPAAPIALDPRSPLGNALAARRFARDGAAYGVRKERLLIPETVAVGGIEVGRFEVTRAQWRSVFPEFPVAAGEENYPVTGISVEDARQFLGTLSKATGRTYRFLAESEHAKLPKGKAENTLDWWAGYALSPASADAVWELASELRGRGGVPPLLLPVGERPCGFRRYGDREVRIFDVGGNAGEWVTTKGGKPKLVGGCAATAKDARATGDRILPAYGGLRVAVDG